MIRNKMRTANTKGGSSSFSPAWNWLCIFTNTYGIGEVSHPARQNPSKRKLKKIRIVIKKTTFKTEQIRLKTKQIKAEYKYEENKK
jgi:hypothetical protein